MCVSFLLWDRQCVVYPIVEWFEFFDIPMLSEARLPYTQVENFDHFVRSFADVQFSQKCGAINSKSAKCIV